MSSFKHLTIQEKLQRCNENTKKSKLLANCNLSSPPPRPSRPQGTEPTERCTKENAVSAPREKVAGPPPADEAGARGFCRCQFVIEIDPRLGQWPWASTPPPSQVDTRDAQGGNGMGCHTGASASPGPHSARAGLVTQEQGQTRRTFDIPQNSTLGSVGQRQPLTARRKSSLGPTLRQGELWGASASFWEEFLSRPTIRHPGPGSTLRP